MKKLLNYGFTLVELLVVIAIIGTLSTIGLASLNGAKESARDSRRMGDIANLRIGLELYNQDWQGYPIPIANTPTGPDISTDNDAGSLFSTINNPLKPIYLNRIFIDPINSVSKNLYYVYDTNENNSHKDYVLCFQKEDENNIWFYQYASGINGEGSCPTLP